MAREKSDSDLTRKHEYAGAAKCKSGVAHTDLTLLVNRRFPQNSPFLNGSSHLWLPTPYFRRYRHTYNPYRVNVTGTDFTVLLMFRCRNIVWEISWVWRLP